MSSSRRTVPSRTGTSGRRSGRWPSSRACCHSPPAAPWRSRCRACSDRVRALLVVLLLLVGLAVVADRVAVGVAEDRVGEQLAAKGGLAGTPEVDIAGFPFLTQAVAGTY